MAVAEVVFWVAAGLLVYTHVGYPLVLALAARRRRATPARRARRAPAVSLIVAAHDEEEVIAAKVANALALDYPRELLELIVASDGCADRTAELARGAGADLVLELPRAGKVPAQNAAVERASGELLAFSDANALWEPDALRELVAPFGDPAVGYACGQARLLDQGGSNQEGAYWRYELGGPRARVGARRGHGRQRGDLRRPRERLPGARTGRQPRPLVPVHAHQARPASGLRAGGGLGGEDGRDHRGRVRAQAADDARALRRGRSRRDARAARLPAGLRVGDLQPPGAPLRLAAPAPDRAGHEPRPARPGHRVRVHARGAAAAAGRGGARRGDPDRGRSGSRATTC